MSKLRRGRQRGGNFSRWKQVRNLQSEDLENIGEMWEEQLI